ncbi:MAG: adenylylsulfate kinase [Oscillospiraceae bacterium]|nr:adenylylsulfate kinase [Oscillospiraceae bacterium]
MSGLQRLLDAAAGWTPPELAGEPPHGDMPGDKVCIGEGHIRKANIIFPALVRELKKTNNEKTVVSVFGGSGVGKSETASVLAAYFRAAGIGSYVMSGDNYPHRIPMYNDAERLRIFRTAGLRALVASGQYGGELQKELSALWESGADADPAAAAERSWLKIYQSAGRAALADYLGTPAEQDYEEVNAILAAFRAGEKSVFLKRMGRTEDARWYTAVDFSETDVLLLEWTHGGNEALRGIDVPILLYSTPEETREHRRLRARDGNTDSPFTTMVLEIEQMELERAIPTVKIMVSKSGELLKGAGE